MRDKIDSLVALEYEPCNVLRQFSKVESPTFIGDTEYDEDFVRTRSDIVRNILLTPLA